MAEISLNRVLFNFEEGNCYMPETTTELGVLEGRMSKWMTIVLLLIAIVTVFINFGVIIRIYRLLKKGGDIRPPFYIIGNLAVSDFLVGLYIIVVFCIDLSQSSSLWKNNCCGFLTGVVVTACQETICTITFIAIDKYIFICHGLTYRVLVTRRRVYIIVMFTWCFSLLIGFLPTFGLHEPGWCSCNFLLYINKAFAVILLLTSVIIPLAIIISLYSVILSLAIKVTRSKMEDSRSSSSGSTSVFRLSLSSKTSRSTTRTASKASSVSRSTSKGSQVQSVRRIVLEKSKDGGVSRSVSEASTLSIASKPSTSPKRKNKKIFVTENYMEPQNITEEKILLKKEHSQGGSDIKEILATVHEVDDSHTPYSPRNSVRQDDDTTDSKTQNAERKIKNMLRKDINSFSPQAVQSTPDDLISQLAMNGDSDNNGKVTLQSYKRIDEEVQSENDSNIQAVRSVKRNSAKKTVSITESSETDDLAEEEQRVPDDSTTRSRNWRRRSYLKRIAVETKDKVQFLQKCKAVKIILLIIMAFVVTYVPFVIGTLVYKANKEPDERLFRALNNLLYCAVVVNSVINPFIYAYGYQEFRIKTQRFKGFFAKERF